MPPAQAEMARVGVKGRPRHLSCAATEILSRVIISSYLVSVVLGGTWSMLALN